MTFKVIIPARYASTRLPGKSLLNIAGKPMIQHVYERALQSDAAEVVIATDDERIAACALEFGASVQMTSISHRSGTDRVAQTVRERAEPKQGVVVNVQGDEPLIAPALINQVAALLETQRDACMSTLCEPIVEVDELFDPGVVKVVFDEAGYALYFSRAPIPWHREEFGKPQKTLPDMPTYYRHVGIYAYRVGYLLDYVNLPASQAELAESLEQLRVLSNGGRIAIARGTQSSGPGIDTPEDLENVRTLLASGGIG
jgi:3-deoxy-manno-octulosonate cytidylyltransferase (CMP-KDO synthetase)